MRQEGKRATKVSIPTNLIAKVFKSNKSMKFCTEDPELILRILPKSELVQGLNQRSFPRQLSQQRFIRSRIRRIIISTTFTEHFT